ncbi:MAG: hypothetical protein ACE5DU_05675 [Nitrosopumilus sp.]
MKKKIHYNSMKNQKEFYKLKKRLIENLKTADSPYYGLSLETLILNS